MPCQLMGVCNFAAQNQKVIVNSIGGNRMEAAIFCRRCRYCQLCLIGSEKNSYVSLQLKEFVYLTSLAKKVVWST